MTHKELYLFVGSYLQKQIPVSLRQLRVALDAQHQSSASTTCVAYEPRIDVFHFFENLNSQLGCSLALANKSRFYSIQT